MAFNRAGESDVIRVHSESDIGNGCGYAGRVQD